MCIVCMYLFHHQWRYNKIKVSRKFMVVKNQYKDINIYILLDDRQYWLPTDFHEVLSIRIPKIQKLVNYLFLICHVNWWHNQEWGLNFPLELRFFKETNAEVFIAFYLCQMSDTLSTPSLKRNWKKSFYSFTEADYMEKAVLVDQNKKKPRTILKCNYIIKTFPVDQNIFFIKEQ